MYSTGYVFRFARLRRFEGTAMAAHPTVHPDPGLDCWRRGAGSPVGPKLGGSGAEARRGRSPKHAAALARRHNEGCKELGRRLGGTRRRADRDAVRRVFRRPRRSRGTRRDRGRSRAAHQFQAAGPDAGGCPQAKVNIAFRRETTVEPLSRACSASPIRIPGGSQALVYRLRDNRLSAGLANQGGPARAQRRSARRRVHA